MLVCFSCDTHRAVGKVGRGKPTIIVVITYHHLLRFPILAHLAPEIFVEGVEMVLQLARIHLVLRVVGRVLVEVGEEDGLRIRWFYVFARASVAMPACADFVVEATVYFVLFGTEDGREVAGGKVGMLAGGSDMDRERMLTSPCLQDRERM